MTNVPVLTGAWRAAVDDWCRSLIAAGRPDSTLYLRRYQVSRLAGVFPDPFQVTAEDLIVWLSDQAWSVETRRSYRSALRSFYAWAVQAGRMGTDPARGLPSIRPVTPSARPAPADVCAAAASTDDPRTRLMVRLAAELGLRRGEVAAVHAGDVEHDTDGATLRVLGKGHRVRRIPISDQLAGELERTAAGGYLFPGREDGHISAKWCGKLVAKALPGAWSMHSLRHRFATAAYAVDRDVFTVQTLLGHASPVTTRRYVQVPADSLRRTVAAVAG